MKPFAYAATYQGHTSFTINEQMGEVGWPELGASVQRLYTESQLDSIRQQIYAYVETIRHGATNHYGTISHCTCGEKDLNALCNEIINKI